MDCYTYSKEKKEKEQKQSEPVFDDSFYQPNYKTSIYVRVISKKIAEEYSVDYEELYNYVMNFNKETRHFIAPYTESFIYMYIFFCIYTERNEEEKVLLKEDIKSIKKILTLCMMMTDYSIFDEPMHRDSWRAVSGFKFKDLYYSVLIFARDIDYRLDPTKEEWENCIKQLDIMIETETQRKNQIELCQKE